MATKEQLRTLAHYLDTDPENPKDVLDILFEGLSASEISNIESKLDIILATAKLKHESECEKAIYSIADKLPEGNKLKEAIDNSKK